MTSRLGSMLPTLITGSSWPRSISAICRAKCQKRRFLARAGVIERTGDDYFDLAGADRSASCS